MFSSHFMVFPTSKKIKKIWGSKTKLHFFVGIFHVFFTFYAISQQNEYFSVKKIPGWGGGGVEILLLLEFWFSIFHVFNISNI